MPTNVSEEWRRSIARMGPADLLQTIELSRGGLQDWLLQLIVERINELEAGHANDPMFQDVRRKAFAMW